MYVRAPVDNVGTCYRKPIMHSYLLCVVCYAQ